MVCAFFLFISVKDFPFLRTDIYIFIFRNLERNLIENLPYALFKDLLHLEVL